MSEIDSPLEEILEAALLAAGEPLSLERMETLFLDGECPSRNELREVLAQLGERHEHGALELIETASGYQLRIRPRLSQWVSRLWDERPQRYSRALLETLALIAYRQPVTRSDIEDVRGVSVSSSIMRTLMERGWIRVVGHRDVPGRPAVYATSRSFLDDFGLKTLDALPPMHELVSGEADGQEAADVRDTNDGQTLLPKPPSSDTQEALDDAPETVQDAPPETADSAETHAETALTQPLSFADLEARLAARAQRSDDQDARTQTHYERSDDHESE